ncbi:ADP-ribosylglycohydrolase family protein [Teredinibacter sp. KSP-S5-2]|uniref:ADP-ribosylglycohydrolase family protein n=1 Tax=Teredinibacter sp. KSP-S5-2 TaxID=3034506 RepID=UPI0029351955|nr:ADP-ribosylglycohydrolase family protein [Teredinibacter sp. KSP-S5-2]WNO10876.1 ADP-ribosylglycohydrolase family protein [Teredinibacter sp. KSP-S5-2]
MDENKNLGCLVGLAVGDALGTTLEFSPRGSFTPIIDMIGGGPFELEPGQWTDDTSMALCLAESLIEKQGFDANDQMGRYCNWFKWGYMSSNGRCFDIGNTVVAALDAYKKTGEPFSGSQDPNTAGNGSIMRLAPVAMYFNPNLGDVIHYCGESSRTTHGAAECIDACRYLGALLYLALNGTSKDEMLNQTVYTPYTEKIKLINSGEFKCKHSTQIRGSGYVIESLEAALWCFYNTDNYQEAVLTAANLGEDADTTAAICGQIAGAFYGYNNIPESWRNKITYKQDIESFAISLMLGNS